MKKLCGPYFLLVLFAAIFLFAISASSQTIEKGEISGTVLDPTGAAIPDASVKIIQVGTGSERTLTTGADGRFAANLLPAGEYRIEVSAKGFATTVVKGVRLAVGQNLIQDVNLKLAAVGQTVEVQAEAGPVDRGETRENTVIDRTYIDQLPINGRDFRDFVNLTPTADTAPGLRSPVRLAGQQGEYTELIIDGVDNRNSFFGEWFGSLETKNFTLPEDAVQEFQVRAGGFSAEFGHSTGGLVNVVTKSGTNEWHGTAHWVFQNLNLVKDTSVPAAPGVVIPPGFNTRHQFGGTLGGPILKDRVFLFLGVDRQKRAGPLGTAFDGQTGCPPATCVNGVAVPELNIANLAALQGTTPQRQDLLTPLIKLDYRITHSTTATSRFNYSRNETDNFTGGGSQIFVIGAVASNFENFVNEGPVASQTVTTVFGPRTVNEARFAYSLERRDRINRGPGPETSITGVGRFGQRFFLPITSHHKRYQAIDNLSHTFSKHDVKVGVDLNANATAQVFIGDAAGVYIFDSLSAFKSRIPSTFTQLFGINGFDAVESGTLPYFWQKELAFYAQDNWRIHPRVTLNLGIRWDGVWNPQPQFTLPGTQVALGRPEISGNKLTQRVGPVPQSIPNDFNNIGPRVGVAWDVTGNSKTIVRGGVGIYYAPLITIFMANTLAGHGARGSVLSVPQCGGTRTTACFTGTTADLVDANGNPLKYPNRLPSKVTPALAPFIPPPNIDFADPDLQSARVLNLQVAVEREIARDFSISATYSYNRSENLRTGGFSLSAPFDRTIDPAKVTGFDKFGRSVGVDSSGAPAFAFAIARLPQSTISGASAITSYGRARYHALILQVKKTVSHNYQFGANYTVSKNDDNATSDRDTDAFLPPSDPFNFLNLDYGRSQLDIRHQFSTYAYILLPFKIEFGTFISARSGRAYPAYAGFCPGASNGYQDGFQCATFFISAVRPVINGALLPRYPFRNSDFAQWDVRLGREFPIYERLRLRFTAEAFNLTNRNNAFSTTFLAGTNGVCDNSTSCFSPGKGPAILDGPSPRGPLAGQFGLKFLF